MGKSNDFAHSNSSPVKNSHPKLVDEPVSNKSNPPKGDDWSEELSEAIHFLDQENIKSGKKLYKVSLTAKQVILIEELRSKFLIDKPVEALEAFFEHGVIEHEDLTNFYRDEVKCFWELLQLFRKFQ